ncbi:hypothetical protein KUCAC02_008033, partial [Chaenocephalus aceratus]
RRSLVTTLTHTLVIYEPYTTGPLPPRQTLSNAQDHNNVIPPRVIAPICVESTLEDFPAAELRSHSAFSPCRFTSLCHLGFCIELFLCCAHGPGGCATGLAYQRHFVKALEEPPGVILSVRHTVSRHTQLVSIESEMWPSQATRHRWLLRWAAALGTKLPRLPIKAPARMLTFVPMLK